MHLSQPGLGNQKWVRFPTQQCLFHCHGSLPSVTCIASTGLQKLPYFQFLPINWWSAPAITRQISITISTKWSNLHFHFHQIEIRMVTPWKFNMDTENNGVEKLAPFRDNCYFEVYLSKSIPPISGVIWTSYSFPTSLLACPWKIVENYIVIKLVDFTYFWEVKNLLTKGAIVTIDHLHPFTKYHQDIPFSPRY